MTQKINFRDILAIKGVGQVDDSIPIDLREYAIQSNEKATEAIPIMSVPKRISLSKKIGKTVYDVTANFSLDGKETILQQFKKLILSTNL